MRNPVLAWSLVAAALAAVPAWGQATVDAVVARLQSEGFEVQQVQETMLGRVRIEAARDGQKREVVVDPTTGEILRDYTDGNGG